MPRLRALVLSVPKPVVAVILPTAVVAVTGVAVSYWTAGTTASGTAATATGTASLLVEQVAAPSEMGPGVPGGAVSVRITNQGAQSVRVNQVAVSIASVTPGSGGGTCGPGDYALSGSPMTTGAAELAPSTNTTFTGASLAFANDPARNQDGCKGATVTLSYVVS